MILKPKYDQYDNKTGPLVKIEALKKKLLAISLKKVELSNDYKKNNENKISRKYEKSKIAISILDFTDVADRGRQKKNEIKYDNKNCKTEGSIDQSKPRDYSIKLFKNDILKKCLKIKEYQPNIVDSIHSKIGDRAKSDTRVITEEIKILNFQRKLFSPSKTKKSNKSEKNNTPTTPNFFAGFEKEHNYINIQSKAIQRNYRQKAKPSKAIETFENRVLINNFIHKIQSDFHHHQSPLKIRFMDEIENVIRSPLKTKKLSPIRGQENISKGELQIYNFQIEPLQKIPHQHIFP